MRETPKADEVLMNSTVEAVSGDWLHVLTAMIKQARQMERDAREYKDELARAQARETETNIQARRDAERADANAAEAGRLREALLKIERHGPIMGSTGDYRQGQLDILENVSTIASLALATNEA